MKTIYIAWAGFQRRAVSMQSLMDFKLVHLPPTQGGVLRKIAGYLRQAASTIRLVLAEKPDAVWVQTPPNFIPHILIALRWANRQKFRILLDCHNATFRAPWINTPLFKIVAAKADLVIAHNEDIAVKARALLPRATPIVVLEDPPAILQKPPATNARQQYVLVPCSFADDEPVSAIIEAARIGPHLQFKVTGRLEKAKAKGFLSDCPDNVHFTGFVSEAEFNKLLHDAAIVLGITTFEDIQLSVANEAIGAEKALVLSGTATLRKLFPDCADFFDNTPASLVATLTHALKNREKMETRSAQSAQRRISLWKQRIDDSGVF